MILNKKIKWNEDMEEDIGGGDESTFIAEYILLPLYERRENLIKRLHWKIQRRAMTRGNNGMKSTTLKCTWNQMKKRILIRIVLKSIFNDMYHHNKKKQI